MASLLATAWPGAAAASSSWRAAVWPQRRCRVEQGALGPHPGGICRRRQSPGRRQSTRLLAPGGWHGRKLTGQGPIGCTCCRPARGCPAQRSHLTPPPPPPRSPGCRIPPPPLQAPPARRTRPAAWPPGHSSGCASRRLLGAARCARQGGELRGAFSRGLRDEKNGAATSAPAPSPGATQVQPGHCLGQAGLTVCALLLRTIYCLLGCRGSMGGGGRLAGPAGCAARAPGLGERRGMAVS